MTKSGWFQKSVKALFNLDKIHPRDLEAREFFMNEAAEAMVSWYLYGRKEFI